MLSFLFKMGFRWPWPSQKLSWGQEGAHPFIYLIDVTDSYLMPGAVLWVTGARKQLRGKAQGGDTAALQTLGPCPALACVIVALLVEKSEHLFLICKVRLLQLSVTYFSPSSLLWREFFLGVYSIHPLFTLFCWVEKLHDSFEMFLLVCFTDCKSNASS